MKQKISFIILTFFLMLLFASAKQVLACSCVQGLPCEYYQQSEISFLGKVVKKTQIKGNFYKFTFNVLEEYKNVEARRRINIYSNVNGAMCGYNFTLGKKYLVFASKSSVSSERKGFLTGSCRGNRLIDDSEKSSILSKFRNFSLTGVPTSIQGILYRKNSTFATDFSFGGIKINATNIEDKSVEYSTYTNKDGRFDLAVSNGTYVVKPELPFGYISFNDGNNQKTVNVKKNQCIQKNVQIGNNSKISGKVIDATGNTIDKARVKLMTMRNSPEQDVDLQYASSENGGNFIFEGIPIGDYILKVELPFNPRANEAKPEIYYKQSASSETANVINIDKGKKIENLIVKLLFSLPKVSLKGKVLDSNKKPINKASIYLRESNYFFEPNGVESNNDGSFEISGYAGREYKLIVVYRKNKTYEHKSEEFVLTEKTKDFVIVLPIK